MKTLNFYRAKYNALESFYGWVDQGSDYDIAIEQSTYYDHSLDEIERIIRDITVATRYARCGRPISNEFKERLRVSISKGRLLNLEAYGLTDKEIKIFKEELKEVEALL